MATTVKETTRISFRTVQDKLQHLNIRNAAHNINSSEISTALNMILSSGALSGKNGRAIAVERYQTVKATQEKLL